MTIRMTMLVLAAAQLAACGMLPSQREETIPEPRIDYGQKLERPTPGAVYQAGTDMSYFEDLKARRVGDLVTIRLVETTAASKNSSTSTSKDSNTSITPPTIAGRGVTANGNPILDTSLEGTREFSGAGSTAQSNSLEGNISGKRNL